MKKAILLILAIAVVFLLALGAGKVFATQEKVNLCHATGSENHPYEAINTADDHSGHEDDFLYNGPVKDNGKPTKDGNEWCEENAPEEPIEDVCPNLDGVQATIPQNYTLNDKEECVERVDNGTPPEKDISETVVPPVAESQIQVTEGK